MRIIQMLAAVLLMGIGLQAAAETRLAVLDVDRALIRSDLANAYRAQMDKDFALDEQRLETLSEEGNALNARLEKEGDFLSKEERQRLMQEVQAKYREFQQLGASIQKLRQQREQDFIKEVRPKLDKVLRELVEEMKLDAILDKRSMVYVSKPLDITAQVIERLNQQ